MSQLYFIIHERYNTVVLYRDVIMTLHTALYYYFRMSNTFSSLTKKCGGGATSRPVLDYLTQVLYEPWLTRLLS